MGRFGLVPRLCRGPGVPADGRGRTETPPAKLSACATCHAHGKIRLRGAPGGVAMRGYGAVRGLVSRAHRPFPVVRSHCRAHRPCASPVRRCAVPLR